MDTATGSDEKWCAEMGGRASGRGVQERELEAGRRALGHRTGGCPCPEATGAREGL